ncbi:MAG TPA: protein kinase [Polyangiaceae bacterium]
MDPFTIGNVIAGKYEITRVLGQGGMGVVVAARHRDLGELVALKFLRPSSSERPESHARFAREARTATRIKNEHVARVYDTGTADGHPFLVMEYLTGEDLARVLRRRGPLPAAEAVDLLLQACEAIADAHNLGIVHRDLKPANLFVTTSSDGAPFVKVLDFGIARSLSPGDPSVTATAAVVGSPLYMSPEQLASSRTVDARADVWSLGVILYEMLAGATPFAGESFATLSAAILRGTYAPVSSLRPDCPPPLEEAIAGALARDRDARLPTVAAFAAAIAPCGTEAARVSLQRIERIAARVPPAGETVEGDTGGATAPQDPPSSVARVMDAPGEITQPPALGTSVALPARRALPPLARFGLVGAAAGLLVVAAVIGVRRTAGSPAAAAATGVEAPAIPGSDAAAATSTGSGDAGEPRWQATPLAVTGFSLGNFAVAQPPGHDHPAGVIGALGFAPSSGDRTAISLLAMDPESGRRIESQLIGYLTEDSVVRVAATPRGVLVAHQAEDALQLQWYTDGTIDAGMRSLPQLGAQKGQTLRGLAVFDDRIVLATSPVRATRGGPTTTTWILDGQGKLLGSYPCHGGLFSPGDATLVRSGDNVVVANFTMTEPDGIPVCAGRLHGPPRWREVTLHGGSLEVGAGGVYFRHPAGPEQPMVVNALDENLRPTGLPPPPARALLRTASCEGLTGTMTEHAEDIGGLEVVYMIACCGDDGGGLFVCHPAKGGP